MGEVKGHDVGTHSGKNVLHYATKDAHLSLYLLALPLLLVITIVTVNSTVNRRYMNGAVFGKGSPHEHPALYSNEPHVDLARLALIKVPTLSSSLVTSLSSISPWDSNS